MLGFLNEVIYVYFVIGFYKGEVYIDVDEFVEVLNIKMVDVILMVKKGEIRDVKIIIGFFFVNMYL